MGRIRTSSSSRVIPSSCRPSRWWSSQAGSPVGLTSGAVSIQPRNARMFVGFYTVVQRGNLMRALNSWFLIAVMVCGATGCAEEQVNYKVDMVPPGEFLLGPEDVLIVTVWKNQ